MNEISRNGSDSNGVFVCGRDILKTDGAKQCAVAPALWRLDALGGIDVQQVGTELLLQPVEHLHHAC